MYYNKHDAKHDKDLPIMKALIAVGLKISTVMVVQVDIVWGGVLHPPLLWAV